MWEYGSVLRAHNIGALPLSLLREAILTAPRVLVIDQVRYLPCPRLRLLTPSFRLSLPSTNTRSTSYPYRDLGRTPAKHDASSLGVHSTLPSLRRPSSPSPNDAIPARVYPTTHANEDPTAYLPPLLDPINTRSTRSRHASRPETSPLLHESRTCARSLRPD